MRESVMVNMSLNEFKDFVKGILLEASEDRIRLGERDEEERPINQREAAKFLDVSEVTIISWKKQGKIPYEQLPGSAKVRFYKSQLRAVIQRNPHLLQASRK
ncbi:helix-turn-helix domain-containing protein [Marinoscillum pacificum]|uniref:helix-turn-helix domain-containing protein n=1 Tax=Marinoscillum pacificum TaxID=392723 RepID=UPI00215769AE|nr:helix-turn-helix domain-containing protein [Marinoscillum pacificum]|tara:strand:- start:308 stop:613 length:306 start_codon:yes stop_codon:yes gene_type:complete